METKSESDGLNILKQHIPELDGLRGFALCAAVIWHYYSCTVTDYTAILRILRPFTDLTILCVDSFFVLSGFLISSILLQSKGSPNFFKTFYIRRMLRIFPMYYFIVGLYVVGVWWDGEQKIPFIFSDPLPIWSYAVFAQTFFMGIVEGQFNFGPHFLGITWSVTIEEQFYFFMPFLIWLIPRKHLIKTCLVLIAICWLTKWGMRDDLMRIYVTMPSRMDSLIMGIMIAYGVQQPGFIHYIKSILPKLHWALLFLVIGLVLFIQFPKEGVWFGFLFTAAGIAFSLCMLIILTHREGKISGFFNLRLFRWLGGISYGVYLSHQAINGTLHQWILNQPPTIHIKNSSLIWQDISVTLLSLLVSLVFSHYAFKLVEKPLIRYGHSFKY